MLVVTVWTGYLVGILALGLGLDLVLAIGRLVLGSTVFRGVVSTTFRVETDQIRWIGSEKVLGDCLVPAVQC